MVLVHLSLGSKHPVPVKPSNWCCLCRKPLNSLLLPLQEALLPALERLSPEQFEWAMSLVHARYPGLPSGPGEEMQFDITCLDSLALRQLMDLTQACARAAKVSKAALGCLCVKSPLCDSPALSSFARVML